MLVVTIADPDMYDGTKRSKNGRKEGARNKDNGVLPSNKRVLHLSKSQDNDEAWSKSLEHTLQYCRHTFSPGTWRKVRGSVHRACDGTEETTNDTNPREKKSGETKQRSRDLKAVKELLRSRGQGKKDRRRFESMTIHR